MDLSRFTADMEYRPFFQPDGLVHSYIVSGPAGSAKMQLANTLAAAAVCSSDGLRPCGTCRHCAKSKKGIHPDIVTVERSKDKREIMIDQMREIRADAVVMPNEAEKKVYIINDADNMNLNAQNAMLKFFEEPPSHAVFILVCENPLALLPTVRSRCTELRLNTGGSSSDPEAQALADEFFSALAAGDAALCAFTFKLEKTDKTQFPGFLEAAQLRAAELMRSGAGRLSPSQLNAAVNALKKGSEYFDLSVGVGHIAGMLCASLTTGT